MNYTYKLPSAVTIGSLTLNPEAIIRIEDGAVIPMAADNADYQEYLEWVAEGNTPAPAE